jgi:hypothetical protein
MAAVRGITDPNIFYGWLKDEPEARMNDRKKYFEEGPDHKKLCGSANLYLDSFLRVSCVTTLLKGHVHHCVRMTCRRLCLHEGTLHCCRSRSAC